MNARTGLLAHTTTSTREHSYVAIAPYPYVLGLNEVSLSTVYGLKKSVSTGSGTTTTFSLGTPAAMNTSALNLRHKSPHTTFHEE